MMHETMIVLPAAYLAAGLCLFCRRLYRIGPRLVAQTEIQILTHVVGPAASSLALAFAVVCALALYLVAWPIRLIWPPEDPA